MKKTRIILTFVFLFLLLSVNVQAAPTRLSGSDRYETASKIALIGWTSSSYAVLTNGENYPDALCATPLAGKYKAPILLTQKDSIPTSTLNVIKTLGVKNIFIIGGTGVVSSSVESQLTSLGITITRLYGQNRYETDLKVAQQLSNVTQIAVVTGEDYADALSISPIAVKENMPIILVPSNTIPQTVKDYVNSNSISKIYVVGKGTSIQSTDGLSNIVEINGSDKYTRNIAIINTFKSDLDFSTFYLATGENFADALSGSILAGLKGNPLMLVGNDIANEKNLLQSSASGANINIFGGIGAISDGTVNNLTNPAQSVETAELSKEIKNVSIKIKKVEQDSDSLKIYITYTNNSDKAVLTGDSLTKIVYKNKQYAYDSDFNFSRYYKKDVPKAQDSIEPMVSMDSVIFFKPIANVDKLNIVLSVGFEDYRFNGVDVNDMAKGQISAVEDQTEAVLAHVTQGNITINLNKIVQDSDSLKVYVTYINNDTKEALTGDSLAKVVANGKQYEYDSDFNFSRYYKKDVPKAQDSIEPTVNEKSIIYFAPIQDVDSINLVLSVGFENYKFNNIKVEVK